MTDNTPSTLIAEYRAKYELVRAKYDCAKADMNRRQAELVETRARLSKCIERIRADGQHLDNIASGHSGEDSTAWQEDVEGFLQDLYND
jgi:hypothetical protein